jgi:GLPGLI family protein
MKINKKYNYFIFIILSTLLLCAQTTQISAQFRDISKKTITDNCKYSITYQYTFVRDTIKKQLYYDRQVLETGDSMSHYYSVYADRVDSIYYETAHNTQLQKPNKNGSDGINPYKEAGLQQNEKTQYENYYMDYPRKGRLTVITAVLFKEFIYEEHLPKFDWKIQSDTLTVLGYKCIKAVTTFRGRTYHAWFTPFIPIRQGPWKFNGLPGLILKAADTEGYFEWMATSIEKPQSRKIYFYNFNKITIQKITRKDFINILNKRWKDPIGLHYSINLNAQSFTYKTTTGKIITINRGDSYNYQLPYIPQFELE